MQKSCAVAFCYGFPHTMAFGNVFVFAAVFGGCCALCHSIQRHCVSCCSNWSNQVTSTTASNGGVCFLKKSCWLARLWRLSRKGETGNYWKWKNLVKHNLLKRKQTINLVAVAWHHHWHCHCIAVDIVMPFCVGHYPVAFFLLPQCTTAMNVVPWCLAMSLIVLQHFLCAAEFGNIFLLCHSVWQHFPLCHGILLWFSSCHGIWNHFLCSSVWRVLCILSQHLEALHIVPQWLEVLRIVPWCLK